MIYKNINNIVINDQMNEIIMIKYNIFLYKN